MNNMVLKIAREAIETYVKTGRKPAVPTKYPKELDEKRGVFVTVYTKPKELRGCIGFPYPQMSLIKGLIAASVEACRDPRFPALAEKELSGVWIEVSILTKPEPVEFKDSKDLLTNLRPGKDGLIIQKDGCSALYLPQVWEEIPRKEDFMSSLSMKAGLLPDEWRDPSAKFYRFQVEAFAERRT